MHPVISETIDTLEARGALKPMPGSDHPAVRYFHRQAPAPASARLVRFNETIATFHIDGLTAEDLQAFFDWQQRFFTLGTQIYLPRGPFMEWAREQMPRLLQNSLPTPYRALVREHVSDLKQKAQGAQPIALHTCPVQPEPTLRKEAPAVANAVRPVFMERPELLLTPILFQGLHLQFLEEMQDGLAQKNAIPEKAMRTYTDAVVRLGINFASASFDRPAVWTALHYAKRVSGDYTQPVIPLDFTKAWEGIQKTGFSSRLHAPDGEGVRIQCPFAHRADKTLRDAHFWNAARMEVNSASQEEDENARVPQGLWWIHELLRGTSSRNHGPHSDDLQAIHYAFRYGYVEGHPYFKEYESQENEKFRNRLCNRQSQIMRRYEAVPA